MKGSRLPALLAAQAAPLLLAGCLVGPDYVPPRASVGDAWLEVDETQITPEPADHPDWWKVFDDPVLDRLIETAQAENLDLHSAGARILQARVLRSLTFIQLFPAIFGTSASAGHVNQSEEVTVPAEVTIETPGAAIGPIGIPAGTVGPLPATVTGSGSFDVYQAGLDAFWEIDVWGKKRRAIEARQAEVEASVADYDDILVSLLGEVAIHYVRIRTLEARIASAREDVALQSRLVAAAAERRRSGAVTAADENLARTLLLQTEARIPALEAALRRNQTALCVLMGRPPQDIDELVGAPGPIPVASTEVAVGIPADLLRRRPDIQRAERMVRAQNARVGEAKAKLLPSFGLFGTLGVASTSKSDLFTSDAVQGAYGGGVIWNIFLFPALMDLQRLEDARFQASVFDYQQTVLRAAKEVEDATTGLLKANEQLAFRSRSVDTSRRAIEVSEEEYANGRLDFTFVRLALEDVAGQRDRVIDTRGAAAIQLIALYKALGGGWQLREGRPILPARITDEMRERMAWERYLEPLPGAVTSPEGRGGS